MSPPGSACYGLDGRSLSPPIAQSCTGRPAGVHQNLGWAAHSSKRRKVLCQANGKHSSAASPSRDIRQQLLPQISRLSRNASSPKRAVDCPAGSSSASDSPSTDGGSGPRDPPSSLKKAAEEEPDDDDLELLSLEQAEELAASKGIQLPADFIQEAQSGGLRKGALLKYFAIQASLFSGFFAKRIPAFRDRLISDHRFLFKVVAEVLIDSGCATVAEVRKRGEEFWTEFEFYLSDMVVGIVMDVLLVTLMAPVAVIGAKSKKSGGKTGWQRAINRVPSAVFEPSVPGVNQYTLVDRTACLGVKFLEYSLAGLVAGFVGQGIANSLMIAKRRIYGAKEDDVAVPPLVMTSLTWGLFMGVSSNVRYQIVFGLERAVDVTIAKAVPQVAYGTSLAIRFANNVIGGENFIDLARWTGIQ